MHTLVDLLIHTDTRQSAILLPEDGTEIGYGSLSDQVDRLAARLRQSGLDPGQVVAIALPNGIEYLPDRFSAHAFWPLVRAHTVTWYSGVPTIHQILLAHAAFDNADSLHRRSYASLA
jgi:acyl-CoA synthetase (AMP-forming)/AMP-acid ligase II